MRIFLQLKDETYDHEGNGHQDKRPDNTRDELTYSKLWFDGGFHRIDDGFRRLINTFS